MVSKLEWAEDGTGQCEAEWEGDRSFGDSGGVTAFDLIRGGHRGGFGVGEMFIDPSSGPELAFASLTSFAFFVCLTRIRTRSSGIHCVITDLGTAK